jgi:hypothetical protein
VANFQRLACPSAARAREILLRNKENLARGLAEAGVHLEMGCHFAYDTGGCLCDRCRPWVKTFLNLAKDVHETFRKYHPAMRSYMSDWHFTDEEARTAIDFFRERKPDWFGGVFKDDRHPADRFTRLPPGYPVLTFLEITEIGGWARSARIRFLSAWSITSETCAARGPGRLRGIQRRHLRRFQQSLGRAHRLGSGRYAGATPPPSTPITSLTRAWPRTSPA